MARQGDPAALAELAAVPRLPSRGAHLWSYFIELNATRQSGGMGISRLSRAEIRLWQQDEGVPLHRWERRAVMAIDAAYVRINSAALAKQK